MKFLAITGAPRSGTTAFAKLLNQDPRILIFQEMTMFYPSIPLTKEHVLADPLSTKPDADMKPILQAKGIPLSIFDQLDPTDHYGLLKLVSGYLGHFPIIGDKSPDIYLSPEGYEGVKKAGAKLLIILRHPLDCMASALRNGNMFRSISQPLHYWMAEQVEALDVAWVTRLEAFLRVGLESDVEKYVFRYCDATACPTRIVGEIQEWLGILPRDLGGLGYKPARIDTWHDVPGMVEKISPRLKELIHAVGYEV